MSGGKVVIVPDPYGLSVCDLDDLIRYLADGVEFDEAVMNAGIDQLDHRDTDHFDRVRKLNATGDAGAYWEPR